MFERFTDRARRVVVQAQEESRRLNHNYIGTEHLLLGLLREDGRGARPRRWPRWGSAWTRPAARSPRSSAAARRRRPGTSRSPRGPRRCWSCPCASRSTWGTTYIGPEHILLGLITEGQGVAVEVLRVLGAPPERTRERVLELARPGGDEPADLPRTGRPVGITATPAQFQRLMNRLGAIDRRLAAIERQLGLGEPPAEAEPG